MRMRSDRACHMWLCASIGNCMAMVSAGCLLASMRCQGCGDALVSNKVVHVVTVCSFLFQDCIV